MMDRPSLLEIVTAVREFLDTQALPQLQGHTAYHGRVAVNALKIAERELAGGADAAAVELEGLRALLGDGTEGDLEQLNRRLCEAIRQGEMGFQTPGLAAHLRRTTIDKVAIDQPGYSGLATARVQ